jgi:hypothetical protein
MIKKSRKDVEANTEDPEYGVIVTRLWVSRSESKSHLIAIICIFSQFVFEALVYTRCSPRISSSIMTSALLGKIIRADE